MGGGLIQLVAYGAQDVYLTGNPQITFFKVVYRRHTNFSIESIQQTFRGSNITASSGSELLTTISRNGDLISGMHLQIDLTGASVTSGVSSYINWTNSTGHAFIKSCEIEIGGQLIDKHYGQWLDIWNELTDHNEEEHTLINKHLGKNAYLTSGGSDALNNLVCYVPLKFWFCRNPGLALPIIALQYHEVRVKCSVRSLNGLINNDGTAVLGAGLAASIALWVDYIYLDVDERRRFAQVSHEYLIEQVQQADPQLSSSVQLFFNHPVKELIWVAQDATAATERTTLGANQDATLNVQGSAMSHGNDYFNYMSPGGTDYREYINGEDSREHFTTAKLTFNGHDRFTERKATYFRTVQPLQAKHRVPTKHIYLYSFALRPEEHQPSGTCNFSRIDNAYLEFGSADTTGSQALNIYAVNYNVLRVMSGMAGLAYSN